MVARVGGSWPPARVSNLLHGKAALNPPNITAMAAILGVRLGKIFMTAETATIPLTMIEREVIDLVRRKPHKLPSVIALLREDDGFPLIRTG